MGKNEPSCTLDPGRLPGFEGKRENSLGCEHEIWFDFPI